jgi:hypothetical protein
MGIDGLYLDNLPSNSLNVSYNQNLPMSVTSYNFTEASEAPYYLSTGEMPELTCYRREMPRLR